MFTWCTSYIYVSQLCQYVLNYHLRSTLQWLTCASVTYLTNRSFTRINYRSPCSVGTIWAMNRKFFFEIGGLDEGMEFWGGENIDLSLRVRHDIGCKPLNPMVTVCWCFKIVFNSGDFFLCARASSRSRCSAGVHGWWQARQCTM